MRNGGPETLFVRGRTQNRFSGNQEVLIIREAILIRSLRA